jgi:hypothetical protein
MCAIGHAEDPAGDILCSACPPVQIGMRRSDICICVYVYVLLSCADVIMYVLMPRGTHMWSRASADAIASARVRHKGIDVPHTHMLFIHTINAHSYIHAHGYIEDRIPDVCARHIRAHLCAQVRVRASACIFERTRILAESCETFPSA